MRPRSAAAVLAFVTAVAGGACSSGGSSTGTTTSVAPSTSRPASPTVTTVATTAIPGATTVPAGTLPLQPTTTIPLTPGATTGPPGEGTGSSPPPISAPAVGEPATTTPAAANPPASNGPGGDAAAFCPAIEQAIPLYYLVTVGSVQRPADAAAYEVAVAPALATPLGQAATNAPAAVAAPFARWAERNAKAVAAFKAAGASDAVVSSFGQSFAKQVNAVVEAGGSQSMPDPLNAAGAAGVTRSRLTAAAQSFAQANGPFESFASTLGADVELTVDQRDLLQAQYPCVDDLSTFAS